jgi:hypothetical protein
MKFTEVKNYLGKPLLRQAMEWDGSFESGVAIMQWVFENGGKASVAAEEGYVRLEVITPGGPMVVFSGEFVLAYRPQELGIFYVSSRETFNDSWVEEK